MGFSIIDVPGQAWGEGGGYVLLYIIVCSFITWLGGMSWVCISALRWFGRTIVGPVKDRIINYFDTAENEIKGLSAEIKSSCKFDPSQHGCKHKSDNN